MRLHVTSSAGGQPARLLAQIHDELLFEVPQGQLRATAAAVQRVMEGVSGGTESFCLDPSCLCRQPVSTSEAHLRWACAPCLQPCQHTSAAAAAALRRSEAECQHEALPRDLNRCTF